MEYMSEERAEAALAEVEASFALEGLYLIQWDRDQIVTCLTGGTMETDFFLAAMRDCGVSV